MCFRESFKILQGDLGGQGLIELLTTVGPTLSAKAVLFPCTDLSVLRISEHRATIEPWYHVALPDHETIFTLTDKLAFARHAEQHGIPIPRFRSLESSADAQAAARELIFPCYLKPGVKTRDWEQQTKHKAFVLQTPAELLDTYRMCSAWTNRLLVQEAILGPIQAHYTCDLYFGKDGTALAAFGSRKLRGWPVKTGTACLSVEEDSDEFRAKALRVFRDTQFHGQAYVEMKRDSRSGDDLVIETNVGRPTGRSAASTRSGIDLLYTMYCDLLNLPAPANHPKKAAGRKWIHLRRDVLAAATQWKTGQLSLRDWCRSVSGPKHFAVFSFRDPKPFLAESKRYLGELLFRKKHRRSRETPGR
jgi:predicted ATP-grasp superfamily ATP-dependent carboligase